MGQGRSFYKWFYNNVHSRYYNLLMTWCFLPFGGEAKVRRAMLEELPLQPADRILDMCCGTGNTTFAIAEMLGPQATVKAIDLSDGQIGVATRRNRFSNVEFLAMDASSTSFAAGSYDRVVIPHALHEMPRQTRLAVLAEARRVLKGGGTLGVLEMDNPPSWLRRLFLGFWWFFWLPFNFETPTRRDMLRQGLASEVREAGFADVSRTSMYDGVFQVVRGQKAGGALAGERA